MYIYGIIDNVRRGMREAKAPTEGEKAMIHEIAVGIRTIKIHHGENGMGHLPDTYKFVADAWVDPVGSIQGHGICSDGTIGTYAYVSVDLPDEIVPSKKHLLELTIPGRKSKCGTDDLCFVVCHTKAEQECTYFGEVRVKELIMQAIDSGMVLFYPDEDGNMCHKPVDVKGIRWMH